MSMEKALSSHYRDLFKCLSGEPDKILKTADRIVKLDATQIDALRAKVVALIKMDQIQDALKALQESPVKSNLVEIGFELAYCYYKTADYKSALECLEKSLSQVAAKGGQSTSLYAHLTHLKAQVLYKLEDFDACLATYGTLELDEDIETNILAVNGAKAMVFGKATFPMSEHASYEWYFNKACLFLALGKLFEAEKLLVKAQKKCREKLVGEDELELELALIAGQLAYIYQLQGKSHEALAQYYAIIKLDGIDPEVAAIAENNSVACRQKSDLFESAKGLKFAKSDMAYSKLNSVQAKVVSANEVILSTLIAKGSSAETKYNEFKAAFPQDPLVILLSSALKRKKKSVSESLKDFEEHSQTYPTSLAIQMTLVQLYMNGSSWEKVIEKLNGLLESGHWPNYTPGFVSLLSWLYSQVNRPSEALSALERVAKSQDNPVILKQLANCKVQLKRFQEAAQDYESCLQSHPEDVESIAGCILAYSELDPSKAMVHVSKLQEFLPTTSLTASQVDALEQVSARFLPREKATVKPKLKKRKRILPKSYDPSVTPDPERWLPKKMRSTHQVSVSKREMSRGTQAVTLEGGGIGSTGSARIQAPLKKEVSSTSISTPISPVNVEQAQSKKNNKKKNKK